MSNSKTTARSASIVGAVAALCTILGFLRDALKSNYFGRGMSVDALVMSTTIVTVLLNLFAVAVSTTFLPLFNDVLIIKSKEEAFKLADKVITMMCTIALIMCALGYTFLKPLVLTTADFSGQKLYITMALTRIMLPMIFFQVATALLNVISQSLGNFRTPAILTLINNTIIILCVILGHSYGIKSLAIGTLLGWAIPFFMQVYFIRNLGYKYKFRFDLKDKLIQGMLITALPVIIGSSVQQLNMVVSQKVASSFSTGGIASLDYANKLNNVIPSVFVFAVITVIFPSMSKLIAEDNINKLKETFATSSNIILIISVPVAVGIMTMSQNVISLLFQQGKFSASDTSVTSIVLVFLSIGVIAAGLRDLINKTFYAMKDTKTPMINGMIGMFINICLVEFFGRVVKLGIIGNALAPSITSNVLCLMLLWSLRKKLNGCNLSKIIIAALKTFVAGIVMAVVIKLLLPIVTNLNFMSGNKLGQLINIMFVGLIGLSAYTLVCLVLKVSELKSVFGIIKKKILGK